MPLGVLNATDLVQIGLHRSEADEGSGDALMDKPLDSFPASMVWLDPDVARTMAEGAEHFPFALLTANGAALVLRGTIREASVATPVWRQR
jgi:hypothetical protein